MATALDIINGALNHIGVKSSENDISDADAADSLIALNDMGEEIEEVLQIGFKSVLLLADEVTIPRSAVGPFKALLAIKLLPAYGKEITAAIASLATSANTSLINASVHIGAIDYPSTLPLGSGNRSNGINEQFFPQKDSSNF